MNDRAWLTKAVFVVFSVVLAIIAGVFIYKATRDDCGCVPPSIINKNSAGGTVEIDLPLIEKTIKLNTSLTQKTEKIAKLLPNEESLHIVRYELCVGACRGKISANTYETYIEKILPTLIAKFALTNSIEQEVKIHRVADFSESGCTQDGKPRDKAIFDDIVTLAKPANFYTAFAKVAERQGEEQDVRVYDLSINDKTPIDPIQTKINDDTFNTYNISVDQNNQAHVRYVWENSHFDKKTFKKGGLAITSKLYLAGASVKIVVPEGVEVSPVNKPFNDAVKQSCVLKSPYEFICDELKNPDAVMFEFEWNLWDRCQGN